ncbi:hypothetical protein CRUP_009854 [Coryphaenoides rupestris]|nr:hypothetical protein CRUP_009854 [Coryphaenoides rupestris]
MEPPPKQTHHHIHPSSSSHSCIEDQTGFSRIFTQRRTPLAPATPAKTPSAGTRKPESDSRVTEAAGVDVVVGFVLEVAPWSLSSLDSLLDSVEGLDLVGPGATGTGVLAAGSSSETESSDSDDDEAPPTTTPKTVKTPLRAVSTLTRTPVPVALGPTRSKPSTESSAAPVTLASKAKPVLVAPSPKKTPVAAATPAKTPSADTRKPESDSSETSSEDEDETPVISKPLPPSRRGTTPAVPLAARADESSDDEDMIPGTPVKSTPGKSILAAARTPIAPVKPLFASKPATAPVAVSSGTASDSKEESAKTVPTLNPSSPVKAKVKATKTPTTLTNPTPKVKGVPKTKIAKTGGAQSTDADAGKKTPVKNSRVTPGSAAASTGHKTKASSTSKSTIPEAPATMSEEHVSKMQSMDALDTSTSHGKTPRVRKSRARAAGALTAPPPEQDKKQAPPRKTATARAKKTAPASLQTPGADVADKSPAATPTATATATSTPRAKKTATPRAKKTATPRSKKTPPAPLQAPAADVADKLLAATPTATAMPTATPTAMPRAKKTVTPRVKKTPPTSLQTPGADVVDKSPTATPRAKKTATPRAKKTPPTPLQTPAAGVADKLPSATPTVMSTPTPARAKRKRDATDGVQVEPKRRKGTSGDKVAAAGAGEVADKKAEGSKPAAVKSKKHLTTSNEVKKEKKNKKTPGDDGVQKAAKTKAGKGQAVPITAEAPFLSESNKKNKIKRKKHQDTVDTAV